MEEQKQSVANCIICSSGSLELDQQVHICLSFAGPYCTSASFSNIRWWYVQIPILEFESSGTTHHFVVLAWTTCALWRKRTGHINIESGFQTKKRFKWHKFHWIFWLQNELKLPLYLPNARRFEIELLYFFVCWTDFGWNSNNGYRGECMLLVIYYNGNYNINVLCT